MSDLRTVQITFDCADPQSLSQFWASALGYVNPGPPGRTVADGEDVFEAWHAFLAEAGVPEGQWNSASAAEDPHGSGPRLFFQRVPEGTRSAVTGADGSVTLVSVKNKVHLDVRAAPGLEGDERMAALEAECARLVEIGATRTQRFEPAPPMSNGFIVMADPEGNVFCLD